MKKLTLKSNVFNKGEKLTRTQLKNLMGGVKKVEGSGDYLCRCDGNIAILWSAQASIDWINANCTGQYQCDQLPNAQP